jgi:NAD(P)H dehydrogenase (quinone)
MRAHLVYAHPEPKSFCGEMMSATQAVLIDAGHQVTISDLYRDAFNPVASAVDFALRRDSSYLSYRLVQRHAIESDIYAPDIAREVERVLAADCSILIFPVFWFSMPAILTGWIDRVFLLGLFYGGRRFYGRGAMARRRALIVASIGAGPHFGAQGIHCELEPMFRHLTRGILG